MDDLKESGIDSPLPTRQSLLSRLRDWQDQPGGQRFLRAVRRNMPGSPDGERVSAQRQIGTGWVNSMFDVNFGFESP